MQRQRKIKTTDRWTDIYATLEHRL